MMPPPYTLRAREAALDLLIELESTRLEVVLIPSADPDCAMRGGMIRVVQNANCKWYRAFCKSHQTRRKRPRRRRNYSDTLIKRAYTVRALESLSEGRSAGIYEERLKPFIKERMKEIERREEVYALDS